MALALYRKYRPRTFAEVIGQEHVTEPLSQALRSGRLHHAYLFSGPRGCGKTSSARILARSLNCEQGPTPEPCGVCGSCRSLMNDGAGSIDVIEIDAASHGGVDDARELREKAFFAPANSRYKIYVIDEAHMVSSAGFNALLKLVEEPPEYVKFIFATTEPEKVLGTIRSRTHHYPFRLIPPAVLRPYLQQLTEAEGVQVEPAVFPLVVRAGGGSARDTLSVLDQLIAGAGPDGVSYSRAIDLLGVTDVTLLDEMCDAVAAGDGAAAYSTIDRVAEAGHDPRRFASDLLERFRDLIVLQQVPDAVAKGLIDGPTDQLEAMGAQAARLGPATLSRCADIVHNGLVDMRGTTAPRLLLELITARMLLPGAEDSTGALLQRLERMERRFALGGEPLTLPEGVPPAVAPVSGGGAPVAAAAPAAPAPAGGADGGGGKSAAMAAAKAAARRAAAGGRPGAPVSAIPAVAPVSAVPVSPAPVSAAPAPEAPAGAAPVSAAPVSAAPVSAAPVSAVPVSAAPASAAPVSAAPPPPSAAGGPDWNDVADGGAAPSAERAASVAEPDLDEPPWDEEPEFDEPQANGGRPGTGVTSAGEARQVAETTSARSAQPVAGADPAVADAASPQGAQPVAGGASAVADAAAAGLGPASADASSLPAAQPVAESTAAVAPDSSQGSREAASAGQLAGTADGRPEASAAPARREPAGVLPDAPEEPGAAAVEAVATPGQLTAQAVRQVWGEVLDEVKKQPRGVVLRAMVADATVRELEGQTLFLTVPSATHAQRISQESALPNALYEILGGRWEIRCEVVGGGASPARGGSASGSRGRNQGSPAQRAEAPAPRQAAPQAGNAPTAAGQQPAATARAPHTQRRQAETPASGADDDWPEPTPPAGLTAAPVAEPIVEDDDEDWPEVRAIPTGAPTRPADAESAAPSRSAAEEAPTDAPIPAHTSTGSAEPSTTPRPEAANTTDYAGADLGNVDLGGAGSAGSESGDAGSGSAGQAHAAVPSTADAPGAGPGNGVPSPVPTPAEPVGGSAGAGQPTTDAHPLAGAEAPGAETASGSAAVAAARAAARAAGARAPGGPANADGVTAAPSSPAAAPPAAAPAAGARGGAASSGLAAARAAAAGARGPSANRQTGKTGEAWADGSPTEEAPYDPEFDGPPSKSAGFEGFDPGDEPLDDVIDEKTARESSEQLAMRLLKEAFGAEKIGES